MTGGEDTRGAARNRLLRLAVVLGGVDRVVTLGNALVRIALLAYTLTNRDYGLYVAVLGIVTTANLLDFGLHYGVVSRVSRAFGEDDRPAIGAVLSTGLILYTFIATIALAGVIPLLFWGPIGWVFGLAPDQISLARQVAIIGFTGLLLSLPTKVASAGLMGLQLTYLVSAYRSLSGIVATTALAVTALVWRGHLVPVAMVSAATDVGAGLVLSVWFVWTRAAVFRVSVGAFERGLVRPLLATGLTFFVANLANLLKRSLVTVAIAHSLGTVAVPRFSVPFALYTTGLAFTDIASSSLWPAYGEAVARRDWAWVERAFRLSTRAAFFVAGALAVMGFVAGDELLAVMTSKIPTPSMALLAWLGLWLVSQVATGASASLLNGIGRNRLVMMAVLVEGALTLAGVAALVRVSGVIGSAAAMALSGGLTAAYLGLVALPAATERKVSGQGATLIRLVPVALFASAVGVAAQGPLLHVVARLVVGAGCALAVYALALWAFVLTQTERSRAAAVMRGGLKLSRR